MSQDKFAIDGHKLYWHLDRVAAWQKDRLVAPIYLEISPVSYCDNRCVFCGLDFARNERVTIDADTLMSRISEMAPLGVKSIMFAGEGEPLLHPRIGDLVRHSRKCGIDVSITTNGMSGNSAVWHEILPELTWIRFSVDAASSEMYSEVHGVTPSCFERTLASLKDAVHVKKERQLPVTIGVQFLMIRQNLVDIVNAVDLYSGIGVDYLSFKPYSEHPQMINKSGFTYTLEMIESIEEEIGRHSAWGDTAIIFRKNATEAYAGAMQRYSSCRALPFWGYISSKGDFYTCSVYLNDERFKAGAIYSETMQSIFFGGKRKTSIAFAEHGLELGRECRINCRMARINEFLEFLVREPGHINFI